MSKILGVRFREIGKIHYFNYPKNDISAGDKVIAETRRGVECGEVIAVCEQKPENAVFGNDEKIIRKASKEDFAVLEIRKSEEKSAEKICRQKIAEHKLKMKLIDVEYMFDRNKIIFYFVSESRVDFRNLVKELARIFKVRIELRQVGIRDEAKILGGLGACGKALCCATFLNDFQPVSIKMAKDQGISLNPTKLSGTCGRLMCCLKYEQEAYQDLILKMPGVGAKVKTPDGPATVIGQNLISGNVKVSMDESGETFTPKVFNFKEITVKKD